MTLDPLLKTLELACAPDHAFTVFCDHVEIWWPLARFSITEERAQALTIEGKVGGRIFETDDDGAEHDWGRLTLWDPPGAVAFSWHPGKPADLATRVCVRFEALPEDRTRLVLEHTHWDVLGDEAAAVHEDYERGWDVVLGHFRDRADAKA